MESLKKVLLMAYDIADTIIIGTMREYPLVISAMRNIPVSGACSIPAMTPPIPTRAKLVMLSDPNPRVLTSKAKNIPEKEPMNNAGAKVPPTPPAAKVNEVAKALSSIIISKSANTIQMLSWKLENISFSNNIEVSPFRAALIAS